MGGSPSISPNKDLVGPNKDLPALSADELAARMLAQWKLPVAPVTVLAAARIFSTTTLREATAKALLQMSIRKRPGAKPGSDSPNTLFEVSFTPPTLHLRFADVSMHATRTVDGGAAAFDYPPEHLALWFTSPDLEQSLPVGEILLNPPKVSVVEGRTSEKHFEIEVHCDAKYWKQLAKGNKRLKIRFVAGVATGIVSVVGNRGGGKTIVRAYYPCSLMGAPDRIVLQPYLEGTGFGGFSWLCKRSNLHVLARDRSACQSTPCRTSSRASEHPPGSDNFFAKNLALVFLDWVLGIRGPRLVQQNTGELGELEPPGVLLDELKPPARRAAARPAAIRQCFMLQKLFSLPQSNNSGCSDSDREQNFSHT